MSAAVDERDHYQRAALADAIDRRRAEVEKRWLERVKADIRGADRVGLTELRDAIPDYLARLATSLRGHSDSVSAGGAEVWAEIAKEHAITRVRLGFDIDQLVHEFRVLRQVLFDLLAQDGVLSDLRQAARLADLLEAAIGVAVKSYVQSRDYQWRKLEAEHVGFVAHELRNPLTTATLVATQLRKTLPLSQTEEHSFDILVRSHSRLAELIERVLQTERFEVGQIAVQQGDHRLKDVLHEPLLTAALEARAKGLSLRASVPDVFVCVDPKLTASAVNNVLENGIKYTDVGLVELTVEVLDSEVVLHVRDDCEGMSAEEMSTLFEPFHRGHSRKPGTGLGLAIAKRALEAQGGSIHVESPGSRGCHFSLRLPKART